jgi:hypothetical protein
MQWWEPDELCAESTADALAAARRNPRYSH